MKDEFRAENHFKKKLLYSLTLNRKIAQFKFLVQISEGLGETCEFSMRFFVKEKIGFTFGATDRKSKKL